MGCAQASASAASATDYKDVVLTPVESRDVTHSINERLRKSMNDESTFVKLLILGAAESGKSTVLRQLRIIHNHGFTEQEKLEFRYLLRENTVDCMRTLCTACQTLNIRFTNEDSRALCEVILRCPQAGDKIPLDIVQPIQRLLLDEGIQHAMTRGNEFHLLDSAPYYFTHMDRFFAPTFMPLDDDVVRVRRPTVGVFETAFNIGNMPFRIYDVGGQRGERRKWIHCFDAVRAIVYVASLSEYDQVLEEDHHRNRIEESLAVFEGTPIINLPWFKATPIILFLNKEDLFREKIKRSDLNIFFPAYTGGLDNYQAAVTFIQNLYFARNKNDTKAIYCHVTDAIATDRNKKTSVWFVWQAIRHIILRNYLDKSGMLDLH